MFSVLIWSNADESAGQIARSLASLVPFAVEGQVRDVAIIAAHTGDELERLADEAGCSLFLPHRLVEAAAAMKSELFLVLTAGYTASDQLFVELGRALSVHDMARPVLIQRRGSWLRDRLKPDIVGFAALRSALAAIGKPDPAKIGRRTGKGGIIRI